MDTERELSPTVGSATIVVGVAPHQDAHVVRAATALAHDLHLPLVCVWVEEDRAPAVPGQGNRHGEVVTVPVDPDSADETGPPEFLAATVREAASAEVPCTAVVRAGDPAHELVRVADEHDARLIVVGARHPGMSGWMHHLVGGTVTGRLAHLQPRPVVVVPPGDHEDPSAVVP